MPRRPVGVFTVKWRLSEILEDLDLKRRELADRAGVSDRTIRHAERGDKRISVEILDRIAAALNACWVEQRRSEPAGFTADSLTAEPEAVIRNFAQAMTIFQENLTPKLEYVFNDSGFLLETPGQRQLPFGGPIPDCDALEFYYRSFFQHLVIDPSIQMPPRIFPPSGSSVAVHGIFNYTHRQSGEIQPFEYFSEFEFRDYQIKWAKLCFDTAAMQEFIETGTLRSG